jgi:hypothetical protein
MAINTNIDFRNSQSFAFGSGTTVPAGPAPGQFAGQMNWQAARSLILGRLVIQTPLTVAEAGAVQGELSALTVQGASLMCSNANVPLAAFSYALEEDQNFMGLGIPANGVVQAQVINLPGAGNTLTGTIYCDPWNDDELGQPPAPSESGASAENFIFGMGRAVAVAPGGVVTLTATALRACVLGRLVVHIEDIVAAPPTFMTSRNLVTIDQVLINQTEQLGSSVNAAVGASAFGVDALGDMTILNQFVPLNGQVSIRFQVSAAAPNNVNIGAAFFCNAS